LPTSLVQCFVPFKCGFLASFPYEASQLVRSVTQADFRRSWDAGSVRHLSHSKHRVAGPRAENGDSRLFRRRARHTRALGAQTIPPGLRPRTRRTVTLQAASPARRQRGDSAATVQQCRRGGRIPPQHPPAPGRTCSYHIPLDHQCRDVRVRVLRERRALRPDKARDPPPPPPPALLHHRLARKRADRPCDKRAAKRHRRVRRRRTRRQRRVRRAASSSCMASLWSALSTAGTGTSSRRSATAAPARSSPPEASRGAGADPTWPAAPVTPRITGPADEGGLIGAGAVGGRAPPSAPAVEMRDGWPLGGMEFEFLAVSTRLTTSCPAARRPLACAERPPAASHLRGVRIGSPDTRCPADVRQGGARFARNGERLWKAPRMRFCRRGAGSGPCSIAGLLSRRDRSCDGGQ
jgi:hypothetical protein